MRAVSAFAFVQQCRTANTAGDRQLMPATGCPCCVRPRMIRQLQARCRGSTKLAMLSAVPMMGVPHPAVRSCSSSIASPTPDYRRALLPTDSGPSSRIALIAGCTAGYSPTRMLGRANSGISAPREAPAGSVGMFGNFLNVSTRSPITLPAIATV
jgi:hypothetical protein